MIASNLTSRNGAGLYNSTAINCRIFDNVGGWYAAAADISTLYTCLIVSNQVTVNTYAKGGAVADGSRLFNCTVVDNATAVTGHGAVSNCVVQNTILWNNTAKGVVVNYADVNNVFSNSCTTPVPAVGWAPGNTTEPPGFMNAATGDYHLSTGSPCTDKGMNFAWMQDPEDPRSRDLDGNPRIQPRVGMVDMGAFERNIALGSILTIR